MNYFPSSPASFIRVEAAALSQLANRMEQEMRSSLDYALALFATRLTEGRRVAVTGVGKSGLIARKIAATFNSTGTPSYFLHPVEALHGDLGMVSQGDLVLALSYSGETVELIRLLPAFARLGLVIISFTGNLKSTLATSSVAALDVSVSEEACSLNLAPTASTTVMLALGDAFALELSKRAGFRPHDFADLHPGGHLGRRLARVRELMHTGDLLPSVSPSTPMSQVIYEMSRKQLGMTTVVVPEPLENQISGKPGGRCLAGIISDGDLRRLMERVGPQAFERTAGDVMNRSPETISGGTLASDALVLMEEKKITSLVVVDKGLVEGVVHLHDLWQLSPR